MNAMAVKFGFVENYILKHIERFEQKIFVYDMNKNVPDKILVYVYLKGHFKSTFSNLNVFSMSEYQPLI